MKITNSAINKIGDIIRKNENDVNYVDAVATLNIWRESHGEILDEYYDKCVKMAAVIDKNIIVAQRLKRLPTIIGKLNRFKSMRLSSMQDIAGVRIIVDDIVQMKIVERRIKRWVDLVKVSDYIDRPKKSGYRGKHFIFKKDDMYVEIQLRTQLQHLWATAVETTDIFRGASLKERDDSSCWHDFFCQVSSVFAIAERTPAVTAYKGYSMSKICELLGANMKKNKIDIQIKSYAVVAPIINDERTRGAYYVVISLDFDSRKANVAGYKESEYHLAFDEYKRREESEDTNGQTVLVAVNQIRKIREAYPNYFMNLNTFLGIITFVLEKNRKEG